MTDGSGVPATSYTDVPAGAWYAGAVQKVTEAGVMNGVGDGKFAPASTLSRAMLAQMIYNMEGAPATEAENTFSDVAATTWYALSVTWAASEGIVTGYTDGTFGPLKNITREQLATMLYRYAGSPQTEGNLSAFSDASSVGGYAKDALAWAVEKGVMNGVGNNTLDPKGSATRAQAAQLITKYMALEA